MKAGLDGNYGQEHQSQHVTSSTPLKNDASLTQPPQIELVGHSIVCAYKYGLFVCCWLMVQVTMYTHTHIVIPIWQRQLSCFVGLFKCILWSILLWRDDGSLWSAYGMPIWSHNFLIRILLLRFITKLLDEIIGLKESYFSPNLINIYTISSLSE